MTLSLRWIRRQAGVVALGGGLLLVAGCGGATDESDGSSASTGQEVKIGVVGSFSGATAFYGQEAKKGAQVAVDELNRSQTKYRYTMVTADDQCTPDGGASAYGSLVDSEQVSVILGSPCSAAALGGMPVAAKGQVPDLIVSATSPDISAQAGAGGNQYTWRMNIDDEIMAGIYSGYIADAGVTRLATIAVDNAYGQGGVNAYKQALPKHGVQIVTSQTYQQGGGDFRSQLSKIRASGAQGMLIIGAHDDAAVMMKQFKELGLNIKVFARGDVVSTAFVDAVKDPSIGDGIQEANNWDATYKSYRDFRRAFRQRFKADPGSYAVQAWLGAQVIARAVDAGGGGGSSEIQQGLSKVSWDSPIGPIKFDDHHQAHHDMFILQLDHGRIVLVKRLPTAAAG